jgi:ribosome biogenesis GTPase A
MTKARRKIAEDLALVDAVCEIRDARIPRASANPDVPELTRGKPRVVALNRADLADPAMTKKWAQALRGNNLAVLETDCKTGRGLDAFPAVVRELLREKLERDAARGITKPIRLMVLGVPNVGKSTFINKIAGRRAAEASNRPGVTRGKQWVSVGGGIELLDTPGILWPKFDDPETGVLLAFTGAVRDEILDLEALGARLFMTLWERYRHAIAERYKLREGDAPDPQNPLELLARRRGFLVSGGEADILRAANAILDEYRAGKLGRITLETPKMTEYA